MYGRRSDSRSALRARPSPSPCGSSHDRKQPAPTHGERPTPELPSVLAFIHGEEDKLRLADDILERNEADLTETAVGRVVAIIAHHEIMAGRDGIDLRVVCKTVLDEIERVIAFAVGQNFFPTLHRLLAHAFFVVNPRRRGLMLDWCAVEHDLSVNDLDLVTGQSDHALNVIDRRVLRQTEDDHIAAFGRESA